MVPGQIIFAVIALLMGTAWGALSLWAATSQRHWAIRLLAVALPLGLFLTVPAHEPVLFYALQSIVVAAGISIRRHRQGESQRIRFSLTSLLVATLVASLLLAVGARNNIPSRWTWLALLAGSISLGIATLLAAWKIRWWKKLFLVPIGLAVAAVPMGLCDALLLGFPEWDRGSAPPMLFGGAATASQLTRATSWLWFNVLLGTYALLCAILGFWSLARADVEWKKWVGRVGVGSLLALIVAPVAWVYVCIPPPTPTRLAIVGKNGFDVMTGARDRFILVRAIDYPDQATNAELAAAMKKNAEAMSMFREMAKLPFQPPPNWSMIDVHNDTEFLRYIARAFVADSTLARREGRLDDVLTNVMDLDHIAHNMERSNMMMVLVSIAVEGMAHQTLAEVRADLDHAQSRRIMEELAEIDANTSAYEDVRAAEDAWAQRTWGWRKQLYDAFAPATGIDDMEGMLVASREAMSRSAVVRRLLLLDLAVRSHQREKGSPPQSLDELGMDESLLVDEFANDQSWIRYEPDEDSYKLYSVGPDHVDNGGVPIGDELWAGDGDLLLDSLFPAKPAKAPAE